MQLFMLLFAFASANLHHIIKYMKGSGPVGPSELPFRCSEKGNQVIFEKISKGWIGTTGFSHGSDMLMLASFCNKYQRAKTRSKHGLCNCLGAVVFNLNQRLEKEETKALPRVDSGRELLRYGT